MVRAPRVAGGAAYNDPGELVASEPSTLKRNDPQSRTGRAGFNGPPVSPPRSEARPAKAPSGTEGIQGELMEPTEFGQMVELMAHHAHVELPAGGRRVGAPIDRPVADREY